MTMNSFKEIGGYFELELGKKRNVIQDGAIALNCARNALRYVIEAYNIKEIYIPFYTCPVVWQSIKKHDCKIKFYHLDNNFMPTVDFPIDAFVLYTNYFGICARNVKKLAEKYENLIVDNAQAFYMPKYGIASFNSIRKFFGVPDGSILYCDKKLNVELPKDTSYQRFSHLLKRIDETAQFGYQDFCENDDSLIGSEIKDISNLTKAIFETIDIESARKKRLENFEFLHEILKDSNRLNIDLDKDDVPMVYPYLNDGMKRKKLIDNKIYVAYYWGSIAKEQPEYDFQENLIPLPIDHRYSREDLRIIVDVLNC